MIIIVRVLNLLDLVTAIVRTPRQQNCLTAALGDRGLPPFPRALLVAFNITSDTLGSVAMTIP